MTSATGSREVKVWIVAILAILLVGIVGWFVFREQAEERTVGTELEESPETLESDGPRLELPADSNETTDPDEFPPSEQPAAETRAGSDEPTREDPADDPDGNRSEGDPVPPPP